MLARYQNGSPQDVVLRFGGLSFAVWQLICLKITEANLPFGGLSFAVWQLTCLKNVEANLLCGGLSFSSLSVAVWQLIGLKICPVPFCCLTVGCWAFWFLQFGSQSV